MRVSIGSLVILALAVAVPIGQTRPKGLDIYVVDVEGGNATLFVSPSGESVLIDSGNGGAAATRDADRIMAAVKDAGLTPDRQSDHHALARRSLRRDGRARRRASRFASSSTTAATCSRRRLPTIS